MKYRKFGRTGWEVSELGYGMWGMGGQWGGTNDPEALASLHKAVELGVNFFDTAWIYGQGHSETLLGQLIKACPDKKLYVTTKIPPKKYPVKPEYKLEEVFTADHIVEYTRKSLVNLGLKSLDLTLLHFWNDTWSDDSRWQQAAKELKSWGLIKAFGISINKFQPENVLKAIKTGLIDAVEVVYNVFEQAPEDVLFPICRDLGVAVIARVPFDEGALTGTLTLDSKWPENDWRSVYFTPEVLKASVERAQALEKDIPAGMTMPEMALRFILSSNDVSTVIPGMRRMRNVESNVVAEEKGALNPELMEKLKNHRWNRGPKLVTVRSGS